MAYVISVANEKGGVAKTTTTISLGAALSEAGHPVLLVDLDSQANLSLALGAEPNSVEHSIADVLIQSAPLETTIQHTEIAGLDLIPSKSEMAMAERFLPVRPGYEKILTQALASVTKKYDFILLDCPPFLGAVTLNSLTASDMLLIPTQPEYFSIYALRNLMGLVRRIRNQYNSRLTYRLVITMMDRRNKIHRTLSDQLHASFSDGLLTTIIETDTRLRESSLAGSPIIVHAPKSRAALQYRALAQEIIEYVKETNQQPA